ncbi:hypothetical protein P9A09_20825 [Serratia marcescens]|uniref:hypothetical protein n=1 Tax=Serratia TaxID=613 RepID=UPI00053521BF|nr:hypothetical protein [Serratia marcescens]ELL0333608.1 hypothetical protein [Serratia marcescens]KHO41396.1 hypothetical protein RT90_17360 [Serratia marcescens]MBH2551445.1 hypothetical protein [Serratia marcescens]MBH3071375.1 hypothetical protein [Serratia marcescens]MBI6168617.1 hypothetical protein [Serratia marcescens]
MKIKERNGTIIDVFAFYAIEDEKVFYGLPPRYGALLAYRKDEVTIVDPTISWRSVFFSNGIYHHSLIEDELLDGLIERDEDNYKHFVAILKAEGSIRQDFPEDLD